MTHPNTSTFSQIYLPKFQMYQEQLLSCIETLVNIDSGTGQVEGVNQVIAYLEEWLRELDFTVSLHPTASYGSNLVAHRKGKGKTRILLVGHVDTVYGAGAAQTNPFTIRDGVAYGPGVIDMKSGDVICIYAMRALIESGFDQYGELWIVFNNDEEVGSPESTPLLRQIAQQVDIGLVLESSRDREILTHARKGSDKYVLEIAGVSAHSGAEPHKGRSAVIELAHKMIAIHHLNTFYPGVTFNVTRITSTEPLNIIPDMARCYISVRAHNRQGLDLASAALENIAASCFVPDTHATLTRVLGRRPYERTPKVMALIEMAQKEGQALGLQIKSEGKGGVSDANLLMEVGIPALDSLGPTGGGMHNLSREHLHIDSIPIRGALLTGLIHRLCLSESTGKEPSTLPVQ